MLMGRLARLLMRFLRTLDGYTVTDLLRPSWSLARLLALQEA